MLECLQQALGYQLRSGRQRKLLGDHDELVSTEAPQCVGVAYDPLQARGNRAQEFIADTMTERVVDGLEIVNVDEQRRHRCLVARGARQHLLDAIEDQRPVRQASQRVVRSEKRKLLLTASQLFVCALALTLKRFTHADEAELETHLQHAESLRECL